MAPERSRRVRGTRATASVLVAVAAVGLSALVVVGDRAEEVVSAARLQAVADLSVLAGVTHPSGGAPAVATANGARLVHRVDGAGVVTVVVEHGDRAAQASATGCLPSVGTARRPTTEGSRARTGCR